MQKVKIKLNNESIVAEVAITESDMYKGLSDRESLGENKGMLFVWKDDSTEPIMVMRDMNFDLDFIAVDGNNIVKELFSADKDYKEDIEFGKIRAILEVNKGTIEKANIKVGDIIEIDKLSGAIKFRGGGTTKGGNVQEVGSIKFDIDDSKTTEGKLYLLDNEGSIAMELDGNERIFSIDHTNSLFKEAVKAKKNNDYKTLGKLVKSILDIHDNQEPEYAEEI